MSGRAGHAGGGGEDRDGRKRSIPARGASGTVPMTDCLYFDHHATTPVAAEVLAAMLPWWTERSGNAASQHRCGRAAAEAVAAARADVAAALHCLPEEILWTSGATEADNLAIKGVMQAAGPGSHLIVNAGEHRAVLDPARRLMRSRTPVTILPINREGAVDPDAVAAAIRPDTRLVSVMLANNEVGTVNDVAAIGGLCRERGVLLHCDAAQAFGHIPIDLARWPVDLLSITAHKLYGPPGIGALVVRRTSDRLPLEPLLDGGGHERGLRSGTLPVPLIIGFAAAVRLTHANLLQESRRVSALRDLLWEQLQRRVEGITRNGSSTSTLPHNLNVTIPAVDGDALLTRLAETELAVSSGAACSSANPEPSHVLRAMGLSDVQARASLRFGLGRSTTREEVERAVEIVANVVQQVRRLSAPSDAGFGGTGSGESGTGAGGRPTRSARDGFDPSG
jgi:cysteine desulfurase